MVIVVDTREKPRAIVKILDEFRRHGVEVVRRALNFADYLRPDRPGIVIDRKQNLSEVASNCVQERKRFVREIERCNKAGSHLIVLIEHGGKIRKLTDVIGWKNPRLRESPYAVSGERLFRIMKAMESYYGIEWQFCDKRNTGKRIIEILEGEDRYAGRGSAGLCGDMEHIQRVPVEADEAG